MAQITPRALLLCLLLVFVTMAARAHAATHETLVDSAGAKYEGEVVDGEAHGEGKLTDSNGVILYSGQWAHTRFHGQGVQTDPEGMVYTGSFLDGVRHGLGQEARSDGIYEGQWHEGQKHGFGVLWSKEEGLVRVGRWILGEFKNECVVPTRVLPLAPFLTPEAKQAEFIWVDGSPVRYEGARNAAQEPHGRGEMIATKTDDKVAGGEWENGLLEGTGHAKFSDDSKYVGGFHLGLMHGDGSLLWADGDHYEGGFSDDQRSGSGRLVYANGNSYAGDWVNDMMDGFGVITWDDGSTFEGQFTANEKEGFGVAWNTAGKRIATGLFTKGSLISSTPVPTYILQVGKLLSEAERGSTLLYPGGSYYIGAVNARGEAHGFGILYDSTDAVASSGTWAQGKLAESKAKADDHLHEDL